MKLVLSSLAYLLSILALVIVAALTAAGAIEPRWPLGVSVALYVVTMIVFLVLMIRDRRPPSADYFEEVER